MQREKTLGDIGDGKMSYHGEKKQLCATCKRSYVNMRLHLKSKTHARCLKQQPMPFFREQQEQGK